MTTHLLQALDLVVRHPGSDVPALNGISLSLPRGRCIAILGHNGSGKSTLLQAALGLLPVTSGSLKILDVPARQAAGRIAYLAQNPRIDWDFPWTVSDFVATGTWTSGPNGDATQAALEELNIAELADKRLNELSGGQRQRVLLARAICQQAEVLLLDEPFTAVDKDSRAFLADFFKRLVDQGKSLVIATHAHDLVGPVFTDAVHLEEGRISDCPLPEGVSPCRH